MSRAISAYLYPGQWLSADESGGLLVPEPNVLFAELPAEQHGPSFDLAWEIYQTCIESLEQYSELGELAHVSVDFFRESRRFRLKSLGDFVRVVGTAPKRGYFEFTDCILPSPVITHSIADDSPDEWEHSVRFVDGERSAHTRRVRRVGATVK
jgi:hypothetical protein